MAEKYRVDNYSEKPTVESLKNLEQRYEKENIFIKAVSQGNIRKCEQMLSASNYTFAIEKRTEDSLRNLKNYTIIFNTLLRKAAELGKVHPYYIDKISSDFAVKIEKLSSVEEGKQLHRDMVQSYCRLVQIHFSKAYSPIIQRVTAKIDADLTSDLSLRAQAEDLCVNASYLSSHFKKEVGITYSEYVNKKRIEYAVKLLKTTNLQVQDVAQRCGMFDSNYFSKVFKKYMHLTPLKYRELNQ